MSVDGHRLEAVRKVLVDEVNRIGSLGNAFIFRLGCERLWFFRQVEHIWGTLEIAASAAAMSQVLSPSLKEETSSKLRCSIEEKCTGMSLWPCGSVAPLSALMVYRAPLSGRPRGDVSTNHNDQEIGLLPALMLFFKEICRIATQSWRICQQAALCRLSNEIGAVNQVEIEKCVAKYGTRSI